MGTKFGFFATAVAIALTLVSCSTSNSNNGTASSGILYVATQGNSSVSAFGITLSNGTLSTNRNAAATGSMPASIAFAGNAAFVSNAQDNTISSFTANSDGTLGTGSTTSLKPLASGPAATSPMGMVVDSGGKFLFVADQGSSTISVFSISNASLTEVSGSPFLTLDPCAQSVATGPVSVAVTPKADFLYVANQFTNTVGAFAVASDGSLSQLAGASCNPAGPSPYPAGTSPSAVELTPDGNFLYVANQGSNNVSAFAVCVNASLTCTNPNGQLTAVPGSPFATGLGPIAIAGAVDKLGEYLFVADYDSNQVSEYRISSGTGALTANTQPTISTGGNPISIVVRPGSGAVLSDGGTTNYVYVANRTSASISAYSYDTTTGTLSLVGSPVTTQGQPSALAVR
jgi:6-phosphogluconolactonase